MTKSHFMYYKNQWSAYCWDMKPLISISLQEILLILKVSLELPEVGKKKTFLTSDKKTYNELFQFEIFNEMTDYPYHQEQIKNGTTDELNDSQKLNFSVDNMEGYKVWNNHEEERRKKMHSPSKAKKVNLLDICVEY